MFQAEPVLWLQSVASPTLTWILHGITLLGYAPAYVAFVLFLAFAVRLRPALSVLLALLLAVTATDTLKNGVAFPRPSDVDARVVEPGDVQPLPLVARGAATSFWGLPTTEARAALRATPEPSYGFPSGHASAAAAFCIGLAAFFRWRGTVLLAVCWPLLMGLSRMYLGRHFLADVIGGLTVGALAAAGAVLVLRWCGAPDEPRGRGRRIDLAAGLAVALAIPTLWWPWFNPAYVGGLVGLVLTLAVVEHVGVPTDAAAWHRRGARLAGAALLYLAVSHALHWVLEAAGWEDLRLPALLTGVLTVGVTFVGGVYLGRRTRAYPAP